MRLLAVCAILAASTQTAGGADSFRCGARIVATGDLAAEVLAACGEPDYRDAWLFRHPLHAGYVTDTEEWYYNFGPNQFVRVLRLRHGRLVEVDADGYGHTQPPDPDCGPGAIVEGLSKYRLLLRCGEPLTRESHALHAPLRRRDGSLVHGVHHPVYRERWVYNLGARYLLRVVTLENGRVTFVDHGARGFD